MLILEFSQKRLRGPRLAGLVFVGFLALLVPTRMVQAASLKIVTTLPDIASLTEEVGGGRS